MKINNDSDLMIKEIANKMKDGIEKRRIRGCFTTCFTLLIVIGGLIWLGITIRDKIPSWVFLVFIIIPTIILIMIALYAIERLIILSWHYLFIRKREEKNEDE